MKAFILVIFCLLSCSFISADNDLYKAAEELIKNLKSQSPMVDGVPLRKYVYEDLNYDNKYEVIEKQNKLEEEGPGFLNVELYEAFELHRIFTYNGGKFQRDYSKFSSYLDNRIEFYRFWQKQIQNPVNLTSDSQGLIKANKQMFLKELERLIKLTENLKK